MVITAPAQLITIPAQLITVRAQLIIANAQPPTIRVAVFIPTENQELICTMLYEICNNLFL